MDKVLVRPIFRVYGLLLAWVILIIILRNFPSPFSISLTLLGIIIIPGFLISRIFKINFTDDKFGQIVLAITLGLIFNLLLCLIAILSSLTIYTLIFSFIISLILIFIICLIVDVFYQTNDDFKFLKIKDYFNKENSIFILLLIVIFLALATISRAGANLNGDPLYHLSTLRKAIDGLPLSVKNLSILKGEVDPAYGVPIWHVFLAVGSKITNTTIFSFWQGILVGLSLLVFSVWYWLFLKIFKSNFLAVLALIIFIIYNFGSDGYIFSRLPVPDTIGQMFLLPLGLGMALKLVFDKSISYKHFIVLAVLMPLIGLIHWTQYFYYLTAIGFFGVLYLIFGFRDNEFKSNFKKILLTLGVTFPIVLIFVLYLQLIGNVVTNSFEMFAGVKTRYFYDRYDKFVLFLKYAYFGMPLIFLFVRKNRILLFLAAILIAGPIINNIPGLREFLIGSLSHVYIKRFYLNLGWAFAVWALIVGFVLIVIDKVFLRLSSNERKLLNNILLILAIIILILEFSWHFLTLIYTQIFSSDIDSYFIQNVSWLFVVIASFCAIILAWQKYNPKISQIFSYEEPKSIFTTLVFTSLFVFFLSVSAHNNIWKNAIANAKNPIFLFSPQDPTESILSLQKLGGKDAINFIKNNIPAKSVIDANTTIANYALASLTDIYTASFTYESNPTVKYKALYKTDVPIKDKLELLKDSPIDYIFFVYNDSKVSPLDEYPQYFEKIYEGKAAIYKINYSNIRQDLN